MSNDGDLEGETGAFLLKVNKQWVISSSYSGQIFGLVLGRNALFAIACLLTITLSFGGWGIYSVYQANQLNLALNQSQLALANMQRHKDKQLLELRKKMDADQNKMVVYARTLGQMQARMSRLDHLGTKLVSVASLDKSEFDFGLEPAFGGPRQEQPNLYSADYSLHDSIQSLDGRLKQLGAQLTAVDYLLEKKRSELVARPHAWPTEGGWISSRYGKRIDPFSGNPAQHFGVDIANRNGAPALATSGGVVTFAGKMKDFGFMIDIEHGYGYKTRYGHLSSISVKPGDVVKSNQLIGRVGSTGHSTGPHLHYEVRRFNKLLNPKSFLPRG